MIGEQEKMNKSVMYSTMGRKEVIMCRVSSYPEPKIQLMFNDLPVASDSYTLEENKNIPRQVRLRHTLFTIYTITLWPLIIAQLGLIDRIK